MVPARLVLLRRGGSPPVGTAITVTGGVVWATLDATGRYYLVATAVAAATGLLLVAWNEL